MADYIALIHKDPDGDYGVSFPDFPGCVTAGATIDEAKAMAAEALAFHVEGMIEDGEAIPMPSDFETVMRERENRDAVAFLVAAPEKTAFGISVLDAVADPEGTEIAFEPPRITGRLSRPVDFD